MINMIYKKSCPRCGGDISSYNLEAGVFCDKCMQDLRTDNIADIENCDIMKNYELFCKARLEFKEFELFFKNKTGNILNPVQRMWAKRFFLGSSFALLAPTGIGKTTFGLLLSAFVNKSYIMFPTKLLVKQALNKYKEWGINALAYTGKKEEKEKIKKDEYDILITTTQFMYKNRSIINKKFDLIFVDDVDSILKSGKKINDILLLLGFDEKTLEKTLALIKEKKYDEIKKLNKKSIYGNLIVSSATANPKSKRVLLFKYLLGFEISRPSFNLRNIEDLYEEECSWEKSAKWIKKLGRGGLVFLPGSETKEKLNDYIKYLQEHDIKAYSYEEFEEHLEEFKEGRCCFAGFASYRNPLARGLDLPEHIRYTLFTGVPKMVFDLSETNYRALYFIMIELLSVLAESGISDEDMEKIKYALEYLKKYVFIIKPSGSAEEKIAKITEQLRGLIQKYGSLIKNSKEINFDGEKIIIADVTGYIQASGRSSRFYKGHLTKGLSLVLIDSQKAFYSLQKKLKWFGNIEFKNIKNVNLKQLINEVDESRKENLKTAFNTAFVIVESPTKAKTISGFFGNPSKRIINNTAVYEILLENRVLLIAASIGHDFDLVKDEGVWGVKDFVPIYEIIENKEEILKAFRITSFEAAEIYVATDPDREGEKIALDLTLSNKPYNKNIKRMEFHEITKTAFYKALNNPRNINLNFVKAQLLRRIADRWIGFKISLYLQKLLKNSRLSAGRVQTPVLKWICDRTEELKEKIFTVRITVDNINIDFDFDKKEEAEKFLISLGEKIEIKKISSQKEELFERPFNTSSLLKEASQKLKFSPQTTMKLAQDLFEKGFITYHRTDSHRISDLGILIAKSYISDNFGIEFFKPRSFENIGAHEAIRTTASMDMNDLRVFILQKGIELSDRHLKLYDLIFRKFIASQMKETTVLKETFLIVTQQKEFITQILEDGFNLVYPIKTVKFTEGEKEIDKTLLNKPKVKPYTYAEIIEEMKTKGIGRPSTYAVIIEKLLERKYITEKKGYIFSTRLGFRVIKEIFESKYQKFVDEKFTAALEASMDEIEKGEKSYEEEIKKIFSLLF